VGLIFWVSLPGLTRQSINLHEVSCEEDGCAGPVSAEASPGV
jgi:hypothetical protein